jgi:hypothetical protein
LESFLLATCRFLSWLTFQPWIWMLHVSLKHWVTFTTLYCIALYVPKGTNRQCWDYVQLYLQPTHMSSWLNQAQGELYLNFTKEQRLLLSQHQLWTPFP